MTHTTRHSEKSDVRRWTFFALFCLLCATMLAGCGSSDRYFSGQAKVKSSLTNAPGSNAWVALSMRVSADGTAHVKYGPIGGVIQGTGSLSGKSFSAQLPSDGVGKIGLQGTETTETEGNETVTGIIGTVTRNPGETGEFIVAESNEAKQLYDLY